MTFYEIQKIQEMKERKMIEQHGVCPGCECSFRHGDRTELAHILPQRKWIIQKYGKEIVHHDLNMKLTHHGFCNSAVQISPNKTEIVEAHVKMIREAIERGE